MARRMAYVMVVVVAFCGVSAAQQGGAGSMGLAVCVGIDKYAVLGDLAGARQQAEAAGRKLEDAGYRFVTVLVDGAERWEKRPTLGNIRREITELSLLAGPGDQMLVFFSGRGLMVDGKAHLVPAHCDEDTALPVQWVVDTLAASKAAGKYLVVDPADGTKDIAASLAQAGTTQGVTILRTGELPAAALKVTKLREPRAGHGRLTFVMHRKLVMNAWGSTRESWRFNNSTFAYTFKFKGDTHEIVFTHELPAGDYDVFQTKWEHWTNHGYFTDGPYEGPERAVIKAGADHVIKLLNVEFPLSPHGTGDFYWDGRRVCRTNSLTKKVILDKDLDREIAKEAPGVGVRTTVIVANAQRGAKLYAMAATGYAKALREAREMQNRVLIADAARETAWLLATARDDALRNARKALALAEEALGLAVETNADNLWYYKDALAAALAENGKFDDAARTMKEAVDEAQNLPIITKPAPHIMTQLEARLKVYGSGKAYHEQ